MKKAQRAAPQALVACGAALRVLCAKILRQNRRFLMPPRLGGAGFSVLWSVGGGGRGRGGGSFQLLLALFGGLHHAAHGAAFVHIHAGDVLIAGGKAQVLGGHGLVRAAEVLVQDACAVLPVGVIHPGVAVDVGRAAGGAHDEDVLRLNFEHGVVQAPDVGDVQAGVDVVGDELAGGVVVRQGVVLQEGLDQGGVEILLSLKALVVGGGVVAIAQDQLGGIAADEVGALGADQVLLAGVLVHGDDVPGDIHLDAAHVVQHGLESVHVDGDIIVHRQLVQLVDHVGDVVDEVFLVGAVGIDLVDLALDVLFAAAHILAVVGVAGDLEGVHGAGVPVDLDIEDDVGHALALGVVPVSVVVDAQQQQVVGAVALRRQVRVLHLIQLAGLALVQGGRHLAVHIPHRAAGGQKHHRQHDQRQLDGVAFVLWLVQRVVPSLSVFCGPVPRAKNVKRVTDELYSIFLQKWSHFAHFRPLPQNPVRFFCHFTIFLHCFCASFAHKSPCAGGTGAFEGCFYWVTRVVPG